MSQMYTAGKLLPVIAAFLVFSACFPREAGADPGLETATFALG